MSVLIAIDQGTTSTRTVVYDNDLNVIDSEQQEYSLIFPEDGWVEVNPSELMKSVYATLDPMLEKYSDISGLGITNQRETTLVWDARSGEQIYNGIVWQDRRTADLCSSLKKSGHEETIKEKTGLLLDPYFSATKIAWIINNVEGAKEKAEQGFLRFGTVDTFLLWRLSDGLIYKTDITNASRTNLFNIHTLKWDNELLELFQVPASMLPEVHDSDAQFGTFSRKNQSIAITGVIGDQQSALVGQKCFGNGDMKATFGTGCFLMVNTGDAPQKSKSGLLTTIAYTLQDQTVYALEGSIFSAGTIIQWLRDNMMFFEDSTLSESFLSSSGESNGVIFIPAFTGIGAPHWNAEIRASFYGITRDTSQKDIVTSAFKALIYQVLEIKGALNKDNVPIKNLSIDGGMAANKKFSQLLADCIKHDVRVPESTESTAIGAAITAGLGAGVFSSLNDLQKDSRNSTFYSPREGIFNKKDLNEWKKFLETLLEAYS
jgi:glycerol kinase